MLSFLLWYLLISLVGWLSFPLAYRLLPELPDRGYAFSRTLGWLVWGFVFWLLASLGVLRNDPGGLLLALLLLLALSVFAWRMRRPVEGVGGSLIPLRAWLFANRRLVLVVELLFLAAFAWMSFIRAANPEAAGTEKPMELAFINAILRSPQFPPHDPWLSGYAISYYYFGYVLVAMLAKLTATPGGVAFNLGLSLVFALSAAGVYGVVYNLLQALRRREAREEGEDRYPAPASFPLFAALLGPLFTLFVSNLEGLLHSLHNRGLFWRGGDSAFWRWLDIPDLNVPPTPPLSLVPQRFWWWWRASRVVQDYDLLGNSKGDIIDEFPAFSFLLGDLHPHVLAMPFAFLVVALALNLFLSGARGRSGELHLRPPTWALAWLGAALLAFGLGVLAAAVASQRMELGLAGLLGLVAGGFVFAGLVSPLNDHGLEIFKRSEAGSQGVGWRLQISPEFFLLLALALGGLAFLNTWDFPVYTALVAGAFAAGLHIAGGSKRGLGSLLKDFLGSGLALGIAGILLYLPFYFGFSSQAGGVIPNLIYATRGAHLWVIFGLLWLPAGAYLVFLWKRYGSRTAMRTGLLFALGLGLLLWALALLLSAIVLLFGNSAFPGLRDLFLGIHGAADAAALFQGAVSRRLSNPGGWITLLVLLAGVLGLLIKGMRSEGERPAGSTPLPHAHLYALLLVLLGALMVFGPEFFYLRDVFGTRINTIFKFYFQAWLLWSAAAAFGAAVLLGALRGGWRAAFIILLVLVVAAGLVYPTFGIWSKTNGLNPERWTLDGTDYFARQSPDEMAAVEWLRQAPLGVTAVAVAERGGSYTEYASVGTFSGQPVVLGWIGHENQWRGGGEEMGTRQADMQRLYCSRDWEETQAVLDQYNIRYVYVGGLERSTYVPGTEGCRAGLEEEKFARSLDPVFRQGGVAIYENRSVDLGSPAR